jgi:hypothetical protein
MERRGKWPAAVQGVQRFSSMDDEAWEQCDDPEPHAAHAIDERTCPGRA